MLGGEACEYAVEGSLLNKEGKVSGGFTIFGIKIDASIKGKAGGAGLTGAAEATTGGVEGEIGAGLGLGAGIKIKIDWTNFKAPKIKWPW